jgi:hypothetical protein
MIFIIMTYSAAMPILYFSGFLLFVAMYWSDKILFLRNYKTPPKYGTELASRALGILEWSIPLHLCFGIYMMTNPEIFSD